MLFYPEGNSTEAVQDAIDAASANGGGIVQLSGDYVIEPAGTITSVLTGHIDYGLHVDADNVEIVGPGCLILAQKPEVTNPFVLLLFGNGGVPGEEGDWRYRVGVRNVTFDASALSQEEREEMSGVAVAAVVAFAYCKYWHALNCTVMDGWGGNAALSSYASSRYGQVRGNRVVGTTSNGCIWCDGARHTHIAHNTVVDAAQCGIIIQSNLDNCESGYAHHNAVIGNVMEVGTLGIQVMGCSHSVVANNHIQLARAGWGIRIAGYSHSSGRYASVKNIVTGNYLTRDTLAGHAFDLYGYDAAFFDGEPLQITDNWIANNYIADTWHKGFILGPQVRNNVIVNNYVGSVIDFEVDETAVDNILTPNVFPE